MPFIFLVRYRQIWGGISWLFRLWLLCSPLCAAEIINVPDAGALMRGTQQLENFNAPMQELPERPRRELREKVGKQVFVVKNFRIIGATLVPSEDIQQTLESWLNHEITFADLEDALQAISDLYQRYGWYARPQLPEQNIVDGVVTIRIIEGKLGAIKVDESAGADVDGERVIKTLTARQKTGDPLSFKDLERATSILNDTPGINVDTAMSQGAQPGEVDLVARVIPKRWWGLNAAADNFGARSTGYNRISVNGNIDSPFGLGDQITANYVGSLGTQFGRMGYTLPLGYDGLRAGVNYSALSYHTINSFAYPIKQFGTAQIAEVLVTYPLWRSVMNNINTALIFDKKHYYNAQQNVSGVPISGASNAQPGVIVPTANKYLTVGTWSLSGDHYDNFLGGGGTFWGSNLTIGNLDLSSSPAVAVIADQIGLNATGQYTKYSGNVSRLQRITEKNLLWISWQGQIASKNLDSSEDLSLGGPQGVRAYPSYEAQGDQGWIGTIESRQNLTDHWQGTAFFDAGRIVVNRSPWKGSFNPNAYNLYGAGVGINYVLPGQLTGKLMVAHPIGTNPGANPITGANNDGTSPGWRFWLSISAVI